MKSKIFSDRSYLPEGIGHVAMLYPFWGKNPEDDKDLQSGRYDHYAEIGHSFFEMTSLSEADIAVLPTPWKFVRDNEIAHNQAIQFAEKANQAGKKVVVFFAGDWLEEVPIKNSIIFRTSFFRSNRKPNEFAMPAWSQDFLEKYLNSQLITRQKQAKPTVGFCGYAPPYGLSFSSRKLKEIIRCGASIVGITRRFPSKSGHTSRARALYALSKSPLVETNFSVRDHFAFANGGSLLPGGQANLVGQFRQEFMQNMVDSDYILCTRGLGNYSLRLYEALSCGRIPVFIDTNCVLPYDFAIEWKKYCVWVDESELPLIAQKVAEFHDKLSPQEFVDLQYECRKLWEQWLSPEAFFANLYRHF